MRWGGRALRRRNAEPSLEVKTTSRRITYVTGSRADFGLMRSTLEGLSRQGGFDLRLVATGMHLWPQYGETLREVEALGVPLALAPVREHGSSGAGMARGIGEMIGGMVSVLERDRPDILLLLGDRGEMLAAAIAAIHLNIVIAHIHGGERSGTVDEPVRHAISKFSHLHLVATEQSAARLVRMGERADAVHVIGAPGLDGLRELARQDRATLCSGLDLDPAGRLALLLYHPVLQETATARETASALVERLLAADCQIVALMPNSDAGAEQVRDVWREAAAAGRMVLRTHLDRSTFVSLMAAVDVMVGNSSSGIIEAATFGTPVVNVGSRQNLRQRNLNVCDVSADPAELDAAIDWAFNAGRIPADNLYGDGRAGERIAAVLESVSLDHALLGKVNAY